MEKKKNYVVFPDDGDCYGIDDFYCGFDHSIGVFAGGGLFCWPNRYGKKTFANSNEDGRIDLLVICKENEIVISRKWSDFYTECECQEEHVKDGKPHFQAPSIEDLVPFVTRLKFEPEADVVHTSEDFLIEKFLRPGIECAPWEEDILDQCRFELPYKFIKTAKEMPYSDFLQTPYWRMVSNELKFERKACQICGSSKNLEVHHTTYDIRGEEICNRNKLQVLCHDCHSKIHGKEK